MSVDSQDILAAFSEFKNEVRVGFADVKTSFRELYGRVGDLEKGTSVTKIFSPQLLTWIIGAAAVLILFAARSISQEIASDIKSSYLKEREEMRIQFEHRFTLMEAELARR